LTGFLALTIGYSQDALCEPGKSTNGSINYAELNIKEFKAKSLPFSEVIADPNDASSKVVFDQGYKGRLCFTSCNFYEGYTSKWSSYFLDLQPYESTCFSLAGGCNSITFPIPDEELEVRVGSNSFKVKMSDPTRNSYYLPLELRRAIANSGDESIVINTSWDKLREYKIGQKTRVLLPIVLDQSKELQSKIENQQPVTSIEARLVELAELRKKGLIKSQEYEEMRRKILGL
jgi:hypothetical protein